MLLLLIGIVLIVVWAARGAPGGGGGAPPTSRALDILDERFARGEIDEEEYRKRRRALEGS